MLVQDLSQSLTSKHLMRVNLMLGCLVKGTSLRAVKHFELVSIQGQYLSTEITLFGKKVARVCSNPNAASIKENSFIFDEVHTFDMFKKLEMLHKNNPKAVDIFNKEVYDMLQESHNDNNNNNK